MFTKGWGSSTGKKVGTGRRGGRDEESWNHQVLVGGGGAEGEAITGTVAAAAKGCTCTLRLSTSSKTQSLLF